MSHTRIINDDCYYKLELKKSRSALDYLLDDVKYNVQSKFHNKLGLVGGPEVSKSKQDLVILESELRGQYYKQSLCPEKRHQYSSNKNRIIIKNNKERIYINKSNPLKTDEVFQFCGLNR